VEKEERERERKKEIACSQCKQSQSSSSSKSLVSFPFSAAYSKRSMSCKEAEGKDKYARGGIGNQSFCVAHSHAHRALGGGMDRRRCFY
jgi:hypothetical protein